MASVGGVDLGSAYVNVVPSTRDFGHRLRRQILPDVAKLGVAIRKTMAEAIADGVTDGVDEGTDDAKKHVEKAAVQYGEVVEKLFGKGTAEGIKDGLKQGGKETTKEGAKSGNQFGSAFGKAVHTRVKAALEHLPSADVNIDDAAAQAKLTALRGQLESLSDQRVGIDISAADARRQILAIEGELHALAADDVDIDVDFNIKKALAEIAALRLAADDNTSAFERMGASISSLVPGARNFGNVLNRSSATLGQMIVLASTLGTTLIPITAALGGLAAMLVAPIAGATAAMGAFGVVAGIAVARTEEQIKEIGKAKDKMLEERTALHQATAALAKHKKGTDAYKDALKAKQSAQEDYNEALKKYRGLMNELSPMQRKFMNAQEGIKDSFDKLIRRNSGAIFEPLIFGMNMLARVMPKLDPLIKATSTVLSELLAMIDKSIRGGMLDRFVTWASETGPRALKSFSIILGNVTVGVAGFFRAFQPAGFDLLSWLESATARFRRFGQSADTNPAVKEFIQYIREVGPIVADALVDITTALIHMLRAGAPIGTTLLKALDRLAEIIVSIPIDTLTDLWIGFGLALIGFKTAAMGARVASALLYGNLRNLIGLRIAVAAAGLALLANSIRNMKSASGGSAHAINSLKTAAGGLMAGFAVGGRWGAAIGGAIGLLYSLTDAAYDATDGFRSTFRNIQKLGGLLGGTDSPLGTAVKGFGGAIQVLTKKLFGNETATKKMSKSQRMSISSVDALTSSLKRQNGALTKNTKRMILKDFAESGGLKTARKAGVSYGLVAKALFRQSDAQWALRKQLTNTSGKTKEQRKAMNHLWKMVRTSNNELRTSQIRQGRLGKAFRDSKKPTKQLAKETQKLANKNKNLGGAIDGIPKDPTIRFHTNGFERVMRQARLVGNAVQDAADSMFDLFTKAKLPTPPVKDYPGLGHATGGLVTGPGSATSDSIPARLSNGEFVMRAASVKKYGTAFMSAINANKFATGGQAGGSIMPGFGFGTGFRALWRSEIEPAINRLIRALRNSGGSTYTPSPDVDTTRDKGSGRLKGFGKGPGRLGGFSFGDNRNDLLQGFVKGAKRWKTVTYDMQLAVGKSAKKMGKDFSRLRVTHLGKLNKAWGKSFSNVMPRRLHSFNKSTSKTLRHTDKRLQGFVKRAVRPTDKAWSNTFTKSMPKRLRSFDSSTSKTVTRTGKRLNNFVRGPVRTTEKSWRTTMTRDLPKSANTMDKKVRGTTRRTSKGLHSFGGVVRSDVPKAFRSGVQSIGKSWGKVRKSTAKPIRYVITDVLNGGLIKAFNKIARFTDSDTMKRLSVGFSSGGFTGRGAKYQPAGVVHKGEYVINKESTTALEKERPGLLARLNGYARGGKVVWPVPGRDTSTYPGHDGVDINRGSGWDDYGDPIVAAFTGRISYVGSGRGYGAPAIFEQGWPGEMVYGHTSQALVKAGQTVRAGQLIGRVGSTGNSTAPHLHFGWPNGTFEAALAFLNGGVVPKGGYANPAPVLPAWAQNIMSAPNKWAKGLLDGGAALNSGFGGLAQGMLNKLIGPVADWATSALGAGMAGAFGPGAKGVWKSLMSTGFYSKQQAAGVMGNMQYESGFVPNIVQGGGRSWNPASAGSAGYGLVQWTPGSKLVPYLHGRKPTIAAQVDALTAQLRGQGPSAEGAAGAALRATRTPEQAARVFGLEYERYAGGVQTGREQAARAIFERFGKGTHDVGGWLANEHIGVNMSGQPEAVLTGSQWRDVRGHLPIDGNGGSYYIQITNWETGKGVMRRQAGKQMNSQRRHDQVVGRQFR